MLIRGLLPETPLGHVVSIRSETDPAMLKNFTADQKRIRTEWRNKIANEKKDDNESLEKAFSNLELMLQRAFG